MIAPVSFPLAKSLSSIGFDKYCSSGYTKRGDRYFHQSGHVRNGQSYYNGRYYTGGEFYCSAPTIADVVTWLYEKHEYWCYTYTNGKIWHPCIQHKFADTAVLSGKIGEFNSPKEAYEAAIEYTLNNLI